MKMAPYTKCQSTLQNRHKGLSKTQQSLHKEYHSSLRVEIRRGVLLIIEYTKCTFFLLDVVEEMKLLIYMLEIQYRCI